MMKTKKKNVATDGDIIKALAQAVALEYPNDPSAPSVVVSCLKGGTWYVSIARYTAAFGQGKTVLHNARAKELREALELVAAEWLKIKDARARLRSMLDDSR